MHHNCNLACTYILLNESIILARFRKRIHHRLSINRPTKRGKERSDGQCQFEKEMDDHLLQCQQILERHPHSERLAKKRASFLKINDINDILFFGTPDCHYC
jgi:hypothetical protein